jgi:methyl-accepting chemotaxis protein
MAIFESKKTRVQRDEHVAALEATVAAIDRSQAVIEFRLDGTIITANQNFLKTLGYTLPEVQGRHHSMFVEPEFGRSQEYQAFWRTLNNGEFLAAKYKRIAKGGGEIWIQASYNPILGKDGKPYKVIKFATDVTQVERERMENEAERARTQAEQDTVVSNLAGALSNLAEGNLTARIEAEFTGRYAQIKRDFNAAMETLQDTVQRISSAADGIRSGTGEVSQAADDLSKRTEQQAASLEETAAALDQITATVRKTAEGANHARDVVTTAKGDAERSGEVVGGAVQAMAEIDKSSKQISNIIGVIDEIAFQTNLLALNAGVEAARAGEAGKGFAVVASEVRALAQRSADAAKEIKALIQASSTQVASGVDLVGQTGTALSRIAQQIADINAIVVDIAGSAKEQATGLAEVNTAVNQMDQVTQQNAAMVEQSTAASHSLAQEAEELGRLVSRFDVGARAAPTAAARSKPAPQRRIAPALKVAGGRGMSAARKPEPETEEGWEEF